MYPVGFEQMRVGGAGQQTEAQMRLWQATVRRQVEPFWRRPRWAYHFRHLLVSRFAQFRQFYMRQLVPVKSG
jgi:hypothetical protein